jgi:signal transduction histidine kinase
MGINKVNRFLILFITLVIAHGQNLFGQEAINYDNKTSILSISSDLEVFEDTSSLTDVKKIIENAQFLKTESNVPSYSFTESTIWCRFKLKNSTGETCFLEISPPILNEITLYQVQESQIDSFKLGSFHADKYSTLKSNNYIFELNDSADYYLVKVRSKTRLFIKARVGSFEALIKKTKTIDTLQGIYAGLVIMVFIYNMFLFYTNRENIYLFYLLHLINLILFFLYMSGYGIKFIWKDYPVINSYFITIINLGYVLSLIFVLNFLDARKKLPLLHKALWAIIIALILNSFVDVFISSYLAGKLLNYIGIVATGFVIAGSIRLVQKGYKHAKTFLYAWIFYIIGIVIQTLQSLNFIPTNEITSNTIQIGSAFEIVLLSIAVGNKINFYKLKRLEAIANEKALLKEKELLKSSQKENLEELFQEQTELLYAKNKELKKQNKEIKKKHDEITEQNRKITEYHDLLETKNKIITNQNEDLKLHKENLEQLIDERTFELKAATIEAENADQLKTAFLKDFSHEIRTPMNAISGFSTLLMDIEVDDESHDYYVEIINTHTDNLLDLIDNIVDLSRIQNKTLTLKKVKFDPGKLFIALLEKFTVETKTREEIVY